MNEPTGGLHPYVPRIASDWDVEAPDSLWRSVDGSLVFVDISGFTNLSERLAQRGRIGAEELTGVLNRVFGRMLDIVFDRGGSLLKFGGDALLLLFETEDHVLQACAATVEMRAALREASKERTTVGRIDLKMSSGIHTGPIDFFLVGDSHRELIVTGPTASTTTEMEATADANEIMISDSVRDLVPAEFVGKGKGNGWLLRKQRINLPTVGPILRDSSHEPDLTTCVPLALREFLEADLGDSEHRIATIGFVKFKGIDSLLAQEGPTRVGEEL
ncbi:MAG: adenylate/guanylate cyclase domain-containing protein, partial [Acidimicrobiia bacterium]